MQKKENRIQHLGLQPHPEGGFYRETYRSTGMLRKDCLPEGFAGRRNHCTAIYYLLPAGAFSAFHKIKSDEVWHFYEGSPIHIYIIAPDGTLQMIRLGNNSSKDEEFQAVVPAGCWFASRPVDSTGYSLVGCTVAPGFDFADFILADRKELIAAYPQYAEIIIALTRADPSS